MKASQRKAIHANQPKRNPQVAIKKEGSHYVVTIGGRGMQIHHSKESAKEQQKQFKAQLTKMRKDGRNFDSKGQSF